MNLKLNLLMQADKPKSMVELQFTPISNQHYAVSVETELNQNQLKQLKKYQFVLIAIECRSGLETENFKSLKSEILNLIYELKERHVKQITIFWNQKRYNVGIMPNVNISNIINEIAEEGQKNAEEQFSYTQTLISLRHHVADIEKQLTQRHNLSIIFISTQIAVSSLIDSSWEQDYMKWLYGRNLHKANIDEQSNKLRNKLRSLPCSNSIYSIGFGRYHDSALLQNLVYLSRNYGSYLSAMRINQIKDILLNVSILASGDITSLRFIWKVTHQDKNTIYFNLETDENCRVFKVKQVSDFILKSKTSEIETFIEFGDKKNSPFVSELQGFDFDLKIQYKTFEDKIHYADLKCNYMVFLLTQIIIQSRDVVIIDRIKDVENNNRYVYLQNFDEYLLERLIYEKNGVKIIFEEVEGIVKEQKMGKTFEFIQKLDNIRDILINVEQIFANIYKKKFSYIEIGQLIGEVSKTDLKRSLKKKLLKRINANPYLLEQVYDNINEYLMKMNYVDVDVKYSHYSKQVGNCIHTKDNFVKAMFNEDCLGIPFIIKRPPSAIADPGRIEVKAVFNHVVSSAAFISNHRMRNNIIRDYYDRENSFFNVDSALSWKVIGNNLGFTSNSQYQIKNQIYEKQVCQSFRKDEVWGVLPLYICEQNWGVAKGITKLALGFTVCDEPLAYTTSQLQTVPFLLLEAFIRFGQNLKYDLEKVDVNIQKFFETKQKFEGIYNSLDTVVTKDDITPEIKEIIFTYMSENKFNRLKLKEIRQQIRRQLDNHSQGKLELKIAVVNQAKRQIELNAMYTKLVEETCQKIILQLSGVYAEIPFNKNIVQKFHNYKNPINRTVDVIPNNLAFIAQIYCVIQSSFLQKPSEQDFHYFFIRLVEQELRRQTDGWKEEYVEECFVNKLLNVEIQKIDHPTVMVLGSSYRQRFEAAKKGEDLKMNEIQEKRNKFELNIKKENTYNQVQRMVLIEYKRLYESTALPMWYTRFKLYGEVEQKLIHKWKSINILTSYNIFTLILQNKTQRKNAKRREVIEAGDYVDPFDYWACVEFIEKSFYDLREKVILRNTVQAVARVFNSVVQVFVMSPDPYEAAGALLGNSVGHGIADFYKGILYSYGTPILHLKLNMLLTGYFDNLQLFTHSQGWRMSKQKMQKLEIKFPHQISQFRYMI